MLKINKITPSKGIRPILPSGKNKEKRPYNKTVDDGGKPDVDKKVNIKHIDERV